MENAVAVRGRGGDGGVGVGGGGGGGGIITETGHAMVFCFGRRWNPPTGPEPDCWFFWDVIAGSAITRWKPIGDGNWELAGGVASRRGEQSRVEQMRIDVEGVGGRKRARRVGRV